MFLAFAVGITLLAGSIGLGVQNRSEERLAVNHGLTSQVEDQATRLERYFERARAINLLTARNAAFRNFYAAPGGRVDKIREGGPAIRAAEDALDYLETLYPQSIGEACFIDSGGAENARVVRGVRATYEDLSPDESGSLFFKPAFALRAGQVYQSGPYVSPDTKEWVISNATPVPGTGLPAAAIVHFEVTIESFRRLAAEISREYEVAVVDGRSGRIVFESDIPTRIGGPLGRSGNHLLASLRSSADSAGFLDVDGQRAAFRRLKGSQQNANDWYVVALHSGTGGSPISEIHWGPIGMGCAALVLLAFAVGLVRRLGRQNSELLELDRIKDDFVASVSHELRTPLTSIRGYLELVLDREAGELTEEQEQFLSVVDRNADRLMHVVGDLLFVAQAHAGTIALDKQPVEAAAVAVESVEAARPAAEGKGIALELDVEDEVELDADRGRLAQVLDNLLSNAVKFTPDGGRVQVRVSAGRGRALIEVSDTGMGISAEEQERLFERFFRTASATSGAIQGTGLGLSIVKAIIEAHGGKIGVRSEVGEGTTFRIELPMRVREVVVA